MATPKYLDLKAVRHELGMSQAELADMIGVSPRTVQACEQGWRNPSPAVEKAALLLLLSSRHGPSFAEYACWEVLGCPPEERASCLAAQTNQGHLCWLISGNICQGRRFHSWEDKKATCLECPFFQKLLPEGFPTQAPHGD